MFLDLEYLCWNMESTRRIVWNHRAPAGSRFGTNEAGSRPLEVLKLAAIGSKGGIDLFSIRGFFGSLAFSSFDCLLAALLSSFFERCRSELSASSII